MANPDTPFPTLNPVGNGAPPTHNGHPNGSGAPTNGATPPSSQETVRQQRFLEELVHNNLLFRQEMFTKLLDPRRNLEDDCGYPPLTASISAELYRLLYDRDPIANRVVSLMPKEAWQSSPLVYEDEDTDDVTPFEEAWDGLETNLAGGSSWHGEEAGGSVWGHLQRANTLSRIGHFGVILLGFDDGKNLQEPVDGTVELVANRNGRLTFNSQNPLNPFPDSYIHEGELNALNDPQPRSVWNGRYDDKGKAIEEMVTPPSLTEDEKVVVNGWVRERELVLNQLKEPTANDAWGAMSGTPQNPGTDAQYAWQGQPTPSSLAGTDQQYFGVQFGPSEQMTDKPPKRTTPLKLLFVRVFDESLVQIVRWEWNIRNPRFGMPVMYRVTLNDPRVQHSGVGLPMATVFVHWSRIIHLSDTYSNASSSEVMSAPVMQPVLNPILDDRKIRGAGAEGYWKSCFVGLSYETHPQLGGDVVMDRAVLRGTHEDYENGLQRALFTSGMTVKSIAPSVVDPTPHHTVALETICIQLGCPVRVFKGSERGELASAQDDSSWNDRVGAYRTGYVTPGVIVPFIDRLIAVGCLPEPDGEGAKKTLKSTPVTNRLRRGNGWLIFNGPVRPPKRPVRNAVTNLPPPSGVASNPGTPAGASSKDSGANLDDKQKPKSVGFVGDSGYHVEWPDLDSTSETQKGAIALQFTQALAAFVAGGCEAAMAVKDWLVRVWHWTEEEAQEVVDAAKEASGDNAPLTIPPPGQEGHPATPPPKPPPPIIAPKAGVPAGTPGAPAGGIPKAVPTGTPKPSPKQLGGI